MTTYNNQQQAIILKGIAQQILQMNIPTFDIVDKMLSEFKVSLDIKKCLLALFIYSNTKNTKQCLNLIKGDTFGDKVNTVIENSLISNGAVELASKLSEEISLGVVCR